MYTRAIEAITSIEPPSNLHGKYLRELCHSCHRCHHVTKQRLHPAQVYQATSATKYPLHLASESHVINEEGAHRSTSGSLQLESTSKNDAHMWESDAARRHRLTHETRI
jgi:hypothetical protein